MKVTRTSIFTGIERSMDLPITEEQVAHWNNRDGYVQDIFSNLSVDEREFILSGVTPDEWKAVFGEEDLEYGEKGEEPLDATPV